MEESSGGYEFKQITEWNEEDVARWMVGGNTHTTVHAMCKHLYTCSERVVCCLCGLLVIMVVYILLTPLIIFVLQHGHHVFRLVYMQ